MAFVALFDACVLVPPSLRDLLMHLSLVDIFRARWTNQIHEEWISSRRDASNARPLEVLERTRMKMDEAVPDCLIEGYGHLIPTLALPDPNDRHVLAAAIHGEVDVIVTNNLKDFPAQILEAYDITAMSADQFVCSLLDEWESKVCKAVENQRATWKNPPRDLDELLEKLEQVGLVNAVPRLRMAMRPSPAPTGPFSPFPKIIALGRDRIQQLCNDWCRGPQAKECGVASVVVAENVSRVEPVFEIYASNFSKGDDLHFPFDRLVEFIIDNGCDEQSRAAMKDRIRRLRQKVGPKLFQRYKLNLDAYPLALRCPSCSRVLVTQHRIFKGQAFGGEFEPTTCPDCGHTFPVEAADFFMIPNVNSRDQSIDFDEQI